MDKSTVERSGKIRESKLANRVLSGNNRTFLALGYPAVLLIETEGLLIRYT